MNQLFQKILFNLVDNSITGTGLAGVSISKHFIPEDLTEEETGRNLNAAFVILLSGADHPLFEAASNYFSKLENDAHWKEQVLFYKNGIDYIGHEIETVCQSFPQFGQNLQAAATWIDTNDSLSWNDDAIKNIWALFFPEGLSCYFETDENIKALRNKRKIQITRLNDKPISNAARELLITSNVLLTVPHKNQPIDGLDLSESLKNKLESVIKEEQNFWYDHPIHIGVETDKNEAVYGLRGLNDAVAFEKERGTIGQDDRMNCVLSVSVTHKGLQKIAKEYLEEEFQKVHNLPHVNVFMFTEVETERLIDTLLIPAAQHYFGVVDRELLQTIFGVDGKYGKHYSFLKAIAACWNVFRDNDLKGTFKIDLDQVFPQKNLVHESGKSAFEHFTTPLWGAQGTDNNGEGVELGMIAGALVNEKDIHESIFTPDVPFPEKIPAGESVVFYSGLPMAFSTQAELMTKYDEAELDGVKECIQRIHVTGGTNGILISALRKYRPFTPTFIGRAEDQAYILSVLFKHKDTNLRYVHRPGLIMRHDKEAFAGDAIQAAKSGRQIGDLARILYFSYYCGALPWAFSKTKEMVDPFTGCFITPIPLTAVYLRLALSVAEKYTEGNKDAIEVQVMARQRLFPLIQKLASQPNTLQKQYTYERNGWNIFYDILDKIESGIQKNETFAIDLKNKAQQLLEDCQIHIGN